MLKVIGAVFLIFIGFCILATGGFGIIIGLLAGIFGIIGGLIGGLIGLIGGLVGALFGVVFGALGLLVPLIIIVLIIAGVVHLVAAL